MEQNFTIIFITQLKNQKNILTSTKMTQININDSLRWDSKTKTIIFIDNFFKEIHVNVINDNLNIFKFRFFLLKGIFSFEPFKVRIKKNSFSTTLYIMYIYTTIFKVLTPVIRFQWLSLLRPYL